MANNSEIARRLIDFTRENGGATLTTDGDSATLTEGYMVGGLVPTLEVRDGDPRMARRVTDWLMAYREIAAERDAYLGGWCAAGVFYFDVSECVATEAEALARGSERGELAVWGVANMAEIACPCG